MIFLYFYFFFFIEFGFKKEMRSPIRLRNYAMIELHRRHLIFIASLSESLLRVIREICMRHRSSRINYSFDSQIFREPKENSGYSEELGMELR